MSVEKPFAFLCGATNILKHASQAIHGERFHWNGVEVFPVSRRFFRYAPGVVVPHAGTRALNPRESVAHVLAKEQLVKNGRLCCQVSGEMVLLRLTNLVMEVRTDRRTPDVTGTLDWCVPYWHLAGTRMHVEIHFANRVNDPDRIAALRVLGVPVLELHLPKKYLNDAEAMRGDDPHTARALIAAVLRSGMNAGTWIAQPSKPPPLEHRNIYDGRVSSV